MHRVIVPLVLALAGAPTAFAQVYKWTDERGVVNYSSTPPPKGRAGRVVDEDSGRVSTVPSNATARDAAPAGERALRDRVERLEQETAGQRQTAAANEAAAQDAYRRWLEQCRADRRTDCDNPNPTYYDPGYGYVVPPVVRPPLRPPRPGPGEFRPTPFVAEGAGGVTGPYYRPPPGGVAAGSGPYGIGGGYNAAPPGGVVVAPGPGGAGARYVPVPEQSIPAGRPMQRPPLPQQR